MRFIHAWQHTQTQLLSALLTLVLSEQQPSPVADNPAGACKPAGAWEPASLLEPGSLPLPNRRTSSIPENEQPLPTASLALPESPGFQLVL